MGTDHLLSAETQSVYSTEPGKFPQIKGASRHRRQLPIPAFLWLGGSELLHLIHQDNLAGLNKFFTAPLQTALT